MGLQENLIGRENAVENQMEDEVGCRDYQENAVDYY